MIPGWQEYGIHQSRHIAAIDGCLPIGSQLPGNAIVRQLHGAHGLPVHIPCNIPFPLFRPIALTPVTGDADSPKGRDIVIFRNRGETTTIRRDPPNPNAYREV
jgi:hypothetical protein